MISAIEIVRAGAAPAGDAGVQKRNFRSSPTARKPSFFLYEVDALDMVADHAAIMQRHLSLEVTLNCRRKVGRGLASPASSFLIRATYMQR